MNINCIIINNRIDKFFSVVLCVAFYFTISCNTSNSKEEKNKNVDYKVAKTDRYKLYELERETALNQRNLLNDLIAIKYVTYTPFSPERNCSIIFSTKRPIVIDNYFFGNNSLDGSFWPDSVKIYYRNPKSSWNSFKQSISSMLRQLPFENQLMNRNNSITYHYGFSIEVIINGNIICRGVYFVDKDQNQKILNIFKYINSEIPFMGENLNSEELLESIFAL